MIKAWNYLKSSDINERRLGNVPPAASTWIYEPKNLQI